MKGNNLEMEQAEVPPDIEAGLRAICLALPGAYEEAAWTGTRWMIRKKTFAHVLMIGGGRPTAYAKAVGTHQELCVMTFRALGSQIDSPQFYDYPFFRPNWFPNIVGIILDDCIDWKELSTLLKVSYSVFAPKKLAALVTTDQK